MTEPTTLTAQIEALPTHAHENRHGAVISRSVDRDAVLSLVRTHEARQQDNENAYQALKDAYEELAAGDIEARQIEAERDALRAEVARLKGPEPCESRNAGFGCELARGHEGSHKALVGWSDDEVSW